jgi:hypothetical protein
MPEAAVGSLHDFGPKQPVGNGKENEVTGAAHGPVVQDRHGNHHFDNSLYRRPRRTRTGLGRRCADVSSGLLPDLCSKGVRATRRLTDGAGGFLPGVRWIAWAWAITLCPPAQMVLKAYPEF